MDLSVSALAMVTHPLQMAVAAVALFYATLALVQPKGRE
jgi:hypothetical protein